MITHTLMVDILMKLSKLTQYKYNCSVLYFLSNKSHTEISILSKTRIVCVYNKKSMNEQISWLKSKYLWILSLNILLIILSSVNRIIEEESMPFFSESLLTKLEKVTNLQNNNLLIYIQTREREETISTRKTISIDEEKILVQ